MENENNISANADSPNTLKSGSTPKKRSARRNIDTANHIQSKTNPTLVNSIDELDEDIFAIGDDELRAFSERLFSTKQDNIRKTIKEATGGKIRTAEPEKTASAAQKAPGEATSAIKSESVQTTAISKPQDGKTSAAPTSEALKTKESGKSLQEENISGKAAAATKSKSSGQTRIAEAIKAALAEDDDEVLTSQPAKKASLLPWKRVKNKPDPRSVSAVAASLRVLDSPHIKSSQNTSSYMLNVLIAMLPLLCWGCYMFGLRVLVILAVSVISCLGLEAVAEIVFRRTITIRDLSALVTAVMITLLTPVNAPLWIPVFCSFIAIVLVKQLFGGIGRNYLNPALTSKLIALILFPKIMTSFTNAFTRVSAFAFSPSFRPVEQTAVQTLKLGQLPQSALSAEFFGKSAGAIGEISVFLILIGFAYLLITKTISWHIPVAFITTSAVLFYIFPQLPFSSDMLSLKFTGYELFSGSFMIGAIFLATEYGSSPKTPSAKLIYGVGCGLLTVLCRFFLPVYDGVEIAIILMSLASRKLDSFFIPAPFGSFLRKSLAKEAGKNGEKSDAANKKTESTANTDKLSRSGKAAGFFSEIGASVGTSFESAIRNAGDRISGSLGKSGAFENATGRRQLVQQRSIQKSQPAQRIVHNPSASAGQNTVQRTSLNSSANAGQNTVQRTSHNLSASAGQNTVQRTSHNSSASAGQSTVQRTSHNSSANAGQSAVQRTSHNSSANAGQSAVYNPSAVTNPARRTQAIPEIRQAQEPNRYSGHSSISQNRNGQNGFVQNQTGYNGNVQSANNDGFQRPSASSVSPRNASQRFSSDTTRPNGRNIKF